MSGLWGPWPPLMANPLFTKGQLQSHFPPAFEAANHIRPFCRSALFRRSFREFKKRPGIPYSPHQAKCSPRSGAAVNTDRSPVGNAVLVYPNTEATRAAPGLSAGPREPCQPPSPKPLKKIVFLRTTFVQIFQQNSVNHAHFLIMPQIFLSTHPPSSPDTVQ